MDRLFLFIILWLFSISQLFAINPVIKAKYPFVLVGDDYDILTEQDMMDDDSYGLTTKFIDYNDPTNSDRYWKCYKTSNFSLRSWNSKFNKKLDEYPVGGLIINAIDKDGVVNSYGMRRALSVDVRDRFIKTWRQLINNQLHVCIHGDFASNRIELIDGKKQQVYGWVFNKLKTKKGCHGYFGCNK
jgi:hypothetical protein